jgi:glycosyltransferase involved in cell wall biosynthesis
VVTVDVEYAIASNIGGGGIGDIAYHEAKALERDGHLQRAYGTVNSSDLQAFDNPLYGYLLEKAVVPFQPFGRPSYGYAIKNKLFDRYVARHLDDPDVFVGWASQCYESLQTANRSGATTFVVRASSHALIQKNLVESEYRKYGIDAPICHPWHTYMDIAEYEEADYILIPSDFVEESFLNMGFERDQLVKIPFGVDTDVFQPADPPDTFRAIFVGQVSLRKGVQYLLPAWAELDIDAELLVVGPVKSNAEFLKERYADNDSIRFLGRRSDVPELMQSSSVFLFPSIEEGSALVTYEAMAAGIPQIVTFNSGSWITDGDEGYVIPSRDTEPIKERVRDLYNDRETAEAMGECARETAKEYSWERHKREFVEACGNL